MNDTVQIENNIGTRKWGALVGLVLAVIAVGIDMTILNVALPTLATSLNASASQLQWFVVAFTLVMSAGLLFASLLGDRFGRKKMLLVGLSIFGLGSLGCAYSNSPATLIIFRVILGFGAAFIVPLSMAVLPVLFNEKERQRAVAIWAAGSFISLPIGPTLGGWLLTHYFWGSVFLINVPVVILAIISVVTLLPETRGAKIIKFDPIGILMASAGLTGLVYGFIEAGQNGWGDAVTLTFILVGIIVLIVFVFWERWFGKRPNNQPAVNLSLFHSREFTWNSILSAAGMLLNYSLLFVAPQFFQAILGTNAIGSGLRLLPLIGGLLVGATSSERIAGSIGTRNTVTIGFIVMTIGFFIGANTNVNSGTPFISLWTAIFGLGMGFVMATAGSAALGQLSPEQSNVGSALMQMMQRAGGPIGVAVLGSILNSIYRGQLNVAGLPSAAAEAAKGSLYAGLEVANKMGSKLLAESAQTSFTHGMDIMFWIAGGFLILCGILALIFLPRNKADMDRQYNKNKGNIGV